jgi:hypothetical protein
MMQPGVHHKGHNGWEKLHHFGKNLAHAAAIGKTLYDVGKIGYGVAQVAAPYVAAALL